MRLALSTAILFVACVAMAEKVEESPATIVYPYYDPRLFFPTSTATTVTTSVSTITCTKSVMGLLACATGRRRRGIQFDDDEEDQFVVSPSAVQG